MKTGCSGSSDTNDEKTSRSSTDVENASPEKCLKNSKKRKDPSEVKPQRAKPLPPAKLNSAERAKNNRKAEAKRRACEAQAVSMRQSSRLASRRMTRARITPDEEDDESYDFDGKQLLEPIPIVQGHCLIS
jgi:hypothetical protein